MDFRTAVEAAQLLRDRRERDGLAHLDGYPHQIRLWESEKAEAWLFGANRSGKTEGLAAGLASMLRFGDFDPRPAYVGNGSWIYDRAVKAWGVSLTYDMNRNILQPKMFRNGAGLDMRPPFIPDSEIASWNITNQTLRLKSGSLCVFKSNDQGRDSFQGADVRIIGFDEVPHEEVYQESTLRVGGGQRLLIRGAATILPPAGEPGGVSWMYNRKVRPWLENDKQDPYLDIFSASIYDNPAISPDEISRLEAQYPPGSPEYLIRLKGVLLPSIGGSLVYPAFMRSYHMNAHIAPLNADGFPEPHVFPYQPLCLSVDFNPINGRWLVGQYINGMFRVLDEIALERSDIASMTMEFRTRFPSHSAELWIYGDATGRRRDGQTGEASFYLIQEYLQNYPCPVRFILPEVNPPVKDRVAAVNLALRPGDGGKRVEIAAHCTCLAENLETTKWKQNGSIDKSVNQSNGADCLGYWISQVAPVPRYQRQADRIRSVRSPRAATGQVFPAGVTFIPQMNAQVGVGTGGRYISMRRR